MAKIRNLAILSISQNLETKENSTITIGVVNWYNHLEISLPLSSVFLPNIFKTYKYETESFRNTLNLMIFHSVISFIKISD